MKPPNAPPYLRENFTDPASYRPLVTDKEPYANVPPGTEFGGLVNTTLFGPVGLAGATPDLGHVILTRPSRSSRAPRKARQT